MGRKRKIRIYTWSLLGILIKQQQQQQQQHI